MFNPIGITPLVRRIVAATTAGAKRHLIPHAIKRAPARALLDTVLLRTCLRAVARGRQQGKEQRRNRNVYEYMRIPNSA